MEDQSKPGEAIKLAAGDIFHIDSGSYNIFSSPINAEVVKRKEIFVWSWS